MTITDFQGTLIAPDHQDYETARFGWNAMIDRRPALIARCACVEDVAAAVRYAAANGLQAVARCGGHSVSGASLPEAGLLIELSGLKAIEVDAEERIAQVGGGCLLGELDAATQEYGLAVTAGIEPSTGVGGLTLGGGIGFLGRKLGLTVDNLVGAQVVLADGSVIETNGNEHPDLFWALRGGGGQFGIVTRFDFRLHRIGPQVHAAMAFYPLERAEEALAWLREYMDSASDDLGAAISFLRLPPAEPFPAEFRGKPSLALVAGHFGAEAEARAALQPFLDQGDLIFGFVQSMPYVQFQQSLAGASPHGGRYYWKSRFIPNLTDEVARLMTAAARDFPGEYSQIFMEVMGGAIGRVGVEETAFANRNARYNLGISAGWSDSALDARAIARVRALFDALAPHSDGGVYLNYIDRDETARADEAFGPNSERLRTVKQRYDPHDLFAGPLGGAG